MEVSPVRSPFPGTSSSVAVPASIVQIASNGDGTATITFDAAVDVGPLDPTQLQNDTTGFPADTLTQLTPTTALANFPDGVNNFDLWELLSPWAGVVFPASGTVTV